MARKKKDTNGTGLSLAEKKWADEAAKANGKQTRIAVDMRDVARIHAEHEVPRPMSEAAFRVASAQAAREHNKIKRIEAEINDFSNGARCTPQGEPLPSRKDEIKALKESSSKLDREIEAESHLILTPCIELHDVNRGIVTVYIDDNGEPGDKVKEARMTPEQRKRAGESPFAPPTGERVNVDQETGPGRLEQDATGGDV